MHLMVRPTRKPLRGELLVPTSKYHVHRALILASLAEGTSRIKGVSDARHVQYTVRLLRDLGTRISVEGDTYVVQGGRYRPRRQTVSAGSSGTTLYLMLGLASLAESPVTVTGQKYFRRRPVGPLLDALRRLGVELDSADGCPPVHLTPGRPTGGRVVIPGTLSQWISGLLLLAPFASGPTVVEVSGELNERPYVELTVAMMRRFGLQVTVSDDWRRFDIAPGQSARPTDLTLPPDLGSAAFGIAAAAIHPSDVLLRGITRLDGDPADHPEIGFLDVVRRMGVPMTVEGEADGVRIRHDGIRLRGTTVDCREVPDMLPVLCTLAGLADGETVFEHIGHVRLKESDRVAAMLQLNAMGADLTVEGDRLRVRGVIAFRGARVSSYNDHRILMSLALAGTKAHGVTTLTYPNAYQISYPGFLEDLTGLGLRLSVEPGPAATPPASLPEQLRHWAEHRPDGTALVDVRDGYDAEITWRELDERVDRAAATLLALGVQPGEAVAYQLPNWHEFVEISLATLRIGAVCCPLMPILRQREMAFALRRSGARVLLIADRFRNRDHRGETASWFAEDPVGRAQVRHVAVVSADGGVVELPADDAGLTWSDWGAATAATPVDTGALAARQPAPDALAQLLFTSGTTGEPKGVLHRHDTLGHAVRLQAERLGLDDRDVVFIPSPLAHQTGFLYGMWLAVTLGVPQLVQAHWNPGTALQAVVKHGATFVQAATPFLADLLKEVEAGGRAPETLRTIVVAGAALPRSLAERATTVLGTTVCGAFGTTETCLGSLSAPNDPPEKVWGTDGRAMPGVGLRVTDDAGGTLPVGREGNFEVRSPTCFVGYLDRPDLTAEAWTSDGWYRTGDLAVIDSGGYVRITGRVKDVINRGGEKVPVAEIEELLHQHPSVDEVAVVGTPDERLGERACAFAALVDGADLDLEAMRKYLDYHQVSKHYWPERLELVDRLPRNPAGKVQKFVLRQRAEALCPAPLEEQKA
ncbi:3-phosphoshikimate 1-carboxyvinyltransferase [Streptomyces sp. NRRL B-1140]|uniref:3-phosphoshikimate 1-carboxyvinyltransferase n=1 Tax=Streptomyces sp. NRRL B-1140 TaxID=1415549 RepID=UPI0003C9B12A|nr:3-phosphoshikimate 1-carboxyvinyltransferase [Streptomyces sp. NRRL B-1140]AGZ94330.1 long-chain-fatty-acid--CoA ligase [Streptomyces sp. NRRL B-1140]KOX06491.1 3-phosphoshikimate 1-carboxyvinyltransferase [Streptomyces sp. NRRL B-1140]